MKHIIRSVEPGSIAEELNISPGDELLTVNGRRIRDVFDYRFFIHDENLLLEVSKPDGEIWELEIEKDEDEDLGMDFKTPLMDRAKRCQNKCVFCFIDQQPPDMRGTLYIKDDDPRLSFLTGNYITLTNISPQEARRIAHYHLSPLRISVHAADPDVRAMMTGNPRAGHLLKILRIFHEAGIAMHFQIVLCRGLNDGAQLDHTVKALMKFYSSTASLSVVPVGLTQYREGLYPLAPFDRNESAALISQVESWQRVCKKRLGSHFVYCADEWYVNAGIDVPPRGHYEDFPQLENGVGMVALFENEFTKALKDLPNSPAAAPVSIGIVTGNAAGVFIKKISALFMASHPQADIKVYEVENRYFGPNVTVSGLLTGRDVTETLEGCAKADGIKLLFLPRNMFRADKRVTLDDMRLHTLNESVGTEIKIGSADGGKFCRQLWHTIRDKS